MVIASAATLVERIASAFFPDQVSDFDRWVARWTDNAKTNMTIETTTGFRDGTLVPFVLREMPNPFLSGGARCGEPWAREAGLVYENGLRDVCGGSDSIWCLDHRNCAKAGELFDRGCREPFIATLSAFDPKLNWFAYRDAPLARLAEAESSLPQGSEADFSRLLIGFLKYRLGSGTDVKPLLAKWLENGKFADDDEIAIYWLYRSFVGIGAAELEAFPGLSWACMLETAKETHLEARRVAGNGVAASVPQRGWNMLADRRRAAFEILDEAERLRPDRFEAQYSRLWIDGDSRMGDSKTRQRLFGEISRRRLDDPNSIKLFVWYNLYPRWGGDDRRRMMLRFAQGCYETQRHDTALPYFYADTMCRYVRDSALDPYGYFREHADVADKCIEVCMRQATNELACGFVRTRAPFVGAAVAFYAGRYEKAAEFAPYFYVMPEYLDDLFFDKDEIRNAVNAFDSRFSEQCVKLQRLYDDGRFRELLDEASRLPDGVPESYSAWQHIRTLVFNAKMNTDFEDGKDVEAEILAYFPGWWNAGWWRADDRTWHTYGGFEWSDHTTWRARIPRNHEIELSLSPKPGTGGRHVLVVSRRVYEETHHLPVNGVPFVVLIWENDRTGVYVENDYYKMFSVDPGLADWKPAHGDVRDVRIVCNDGRCDVFIDGGNDPIVSTTEYAGAIRHSPKTGLASFHGENVAISGIAVRKPPADPKTDGNR